MNHSVSADCVGFGTVVSYLCPTTYLLLGFHDTDTASNFRGATLTEWFSGQLVLSNKRVWSWEKMDTVRLLFVDQGIITVGDGHTALSVSQGEAWPSVALITPMKSRTPSYANQENVSLSLVIAGAMVTLKKSRTSGPAGRCRRTHRQRYPSPRKLNMVGRKGVWNAHRVPQPAHSPGAKIIINDFGLFASLKSRFF